ncbi:hypothetical protein Cs7R123_68640 [Catellatospora sp. TT07R-123]|uniref:hypothetical protein n=1 Tax=Catellatospora sp. TT07R-123 TaxID=2733863 RepID=UPI001B1A2792|nr:hypothetical protein [Catellatospora sp. TT07R-123]GHJ49522.1 hypothetical protein Cs7R123_68640 [Catellatospora sp. TT07R-123]
MRTSSAVLGAGVALAAFGATLFGAAPALAATHTVGCESGYSNIACDLYGPAADSVKWSMNGVYIPSWDNKLSVSTACTVGQRYSFKATVTTGGVVETPVYNVVCRRVPV